MNGNGPSFVRVPPGQYDVQFGASLSAWDFTTFAFGADVRNESCGTITDENRAACQSPP